MDLETASEVLQRARAAIREAMDHWDGTDLVHVESSRLLLVSAVSDMRHFETAVRHGDVFPSEELRASLREVRQDIVAATRLVDACVAFHRGMAARIGTTPVAYNGKGQIDGETNSVEPEVHA